MICLRYFFIALTFLTRISIFQPKEWKEEDFSKSVKFFPLVGGVLGLFYAVFAYLFFTNDFFLDYKHIFSSILIFLILFLSGPLFFDGFMDTIDGIFSGRESEKILEIMKDSRVGANAVMAFGVYLILLYSSLLDMDKNIMFYSLLSAPIISHFMVILSIKFFPYARKNGIGKMFEIKDKFTVIFAVSFTLLLIFPCGILAYYALFFNLCFTVIFNKFLTKLLGGLTGDTYGTVATVSFLLTQLVFLFLSNVTYGNL